jgi:hypothetical protein
MAKVKISDLDVAATLDGTELVELEQAGGSVQCTTQDIADLGGGGYLKYVALLTQTGTSAPTATVLENTLGGTVVYAYDGTGTFSGTLAGVFTAGKSWISATLNSDLSAGYIVTAEFPDEDSFVLIQRNSGGSVIDQAGIYIEIRVYP